MQEQRHATNQEAMNEREKKHCCKNSEEVKRMQDGIRDHTRMDYDH